MNSEERLYLEALTRDREESADMLEKPSMRGIKKSVVEKYSDQAHFIYELLQNADDAGANSARFILEPDRLIFAHNGSRHFSVSDPLFEDEDSANGCLGDINAITSIANSNKTGASIGKFGVGFKAVFQYTSTPHIYGPEFKFRIDRFIVPSLLENDCPLRASDETLFIFPFDHENCTAEDAYNDISEKLQNLRYPLLFLSGLENIEFQIGDIIGLYGKTVLKNQVFEAPVPARGKLICLTQNSGDNIYDEKMWMFSRCDTEGREYSVCFFLNADGKLRPVSEPAFCFFPTKEVTGLKFLIHAPFLLTDSREGIRAGIAHNDNMIDLLAKLSADAMIFLRDVGLQEKRILIDDDIISIIPIDPDSFSDMAEKHKISFYPFYWYIKEKFKTEKLIPALNGYTDINNAYWASYRLLPQLFSDRQLSMICHNPNARWAFPSISRDEISTSNKRLFIYIDSLVRTNINEDAIITGRTRTHTYVPAYKEFRDYEPILGITEDFTETQSIDWLIELYKWIASTKHRTQLCLKVPIFLDQDEHAAAAFDSDGESILFLPVPNISGCRVVNSKILADPDSAAFVKQIGISEPSLRDQIYNIILPIYESEEAIDSDPHFKIFFDYYCQCPNEDIDSFIKIIKPCPFLNYLDPEDNMYYRDVASALYLPTPELKKFMEPVPSAHFLDYERYLNMVGTRNEKLLISFLTELGILKTPKTLTISIDYQNTDRLDLPNPRSSNTPSYSEKIIEGCRENMNRISDSHSSTESALMWNILLSVIEEHCQSWECSSISSLLSGECRYFYRSNKIKKFTSSDAVLLKNTCWLVNRRGEFHKPCELNRMELSNIYDLNSNAANSLIEFLEIPDAPEDDSLNSNLTDSQREKIQFADRIMSLGLDNESIITEFLEYKAQKSSVSNTPKTLNHEQNSISTNVSPNSSTTGSNNVSSGAAPEVSPSPELSNLSPAKSKVLSDIVLHTDRRSKESSLPSPQEEDIDSDDFMPKPVDYSSRIEKAKEKSAAEIDKILKYEELQTQAIQAERYSFNWFNTLLQMECLNSAEGNSNSKEVSISFAKVEPEPGTHRTLILKYPSRNIPQFMEDIADIPLKLHMGDKVKTLPIEVANIHSYTLRVKLKNAADIEGIDFSAVSYAEITATSPIFLLEALKEGFSKLPFEPDFNMQENLCENIEFIFGPPGTGKTTHLARNILLPIMENENARVLVLTPTNKAADVLTKRLMDVAEDKASTYDWLVRFGITGDEELEESPVFKDKSFDIRSLTKSVTITTIARLPYDFFMPKGERLFLNAINWDYIVIDEASMIPLANIVYPLFLKTPKKFYIAGDPFQIEPITSVELWKDENIYKMVHLESFTDPSTVPHPYSVTLLTTQYRSLPEVGEIFSRFTYGGILKSHRKSSDRREIRLDIPVEISTLNIIKFPVSKYESIYRSKRLNHSSSYQIYSALFTYEFTSYLARSIARCNPDEIFRIGIIAPYRAQADIIEKLVNAEEFPETVEVQVGTIHGFQGDECDIIFTVFNPPPSISSSPTMFLNKKNIINVAISRARDYLFVLMPDKSTERIENLRLVNKVEALIKDNPKYKEFKSNELENIMFGDSSYLENNSFSTGHQSVNVYGLPENKYEIRTEETAVDVQIHNGN